MTPIIGLRLELILYNVSLELNRSKWYPYLQVGPKLPFSLPLLSRLVIETLEGVAPSKKCFRLIGGVLVERTVGEVAPALVSNRDKVSPEPAS